MNPKEQAAQQSLQNFEKIQQGINPSKAPTFFEDYWNKGFNLGRFEEKNDLLKPAAQFGNFIASSIIEPVISSPETIYQGGVDISQGKYYSGTGKIIKGGLDLVSFIPVGRVVGVGAKVAKGAAGGLTKTVLKEAGIGSAFGTGYGVAEGLQQAQNLPESQRLGRIGTEAGIQAGIGGAIGGAFPLIGAGIGKTFRYFFPEKAPVMGSKSEIADSIAQSVDNFKSRIDLPTTKPTTRTEIITPKVELSAISEPRPTKMSQVKKLKAVKERPVVKLAADISEQTPRTGKQFVDDAVKTGKVQSTSKVSRDKASRILDNLIAGNDGGANNIIKTSTKEERRRTYKFLQSLYNKGGFPEEYRTILNNFIKGDTSTTYIQRSSGEAFQQARQKVTEMNQSLKIEFAKEIIDMYNAKINQLRDAGVAETSWPRAILTEFTNRFPQNAGNETVIEDYLNAIATDLAAAGDSSLSSQLQKVTATMYTASGQISQGAANSLQTLIRKTEDIFDSMRSKTDKRTYELVKGASRTINDELTAVNNQVVNDPALQEALFDLEDFFVQNLTESLGLKLPKQKLKDEQIIANAWKKAVDSLVPSEDKKESERLSESILQSILIGKSELQANGIKPKINPEEALYQRLKYAFDNIDEIANKVESAKNQLKVLISQDPNKMATAEPIFNRMIPEVFVTRQVDKMYSYLIKDLKPNFKEITKDYQNYLDFRNKLEDEFYKRVPVDKTKATQMVQLLKNKFDAKYEIEKRKIKLPSQVVAERVIKTAERLSTTQSEVFESNVNKMLIELSYQLYRKELRLPKETQKKALDNLRKDMYAKWRIMLENPVKFRQVLLGAQEQIRDSFPNRVPEVDAILENYMGRLFGDVWAASDITKAAQDQLKKNNISIVDLVKKHTSIQGSTLDDLKRSFINDLGVSDTVADGMARQFIDFINVKADTTRSEIVKRVLRPVIPQEKERVKASQKILEYANLGIFDDVKTANVLAEKLKLPHLSESDTQFIASRLSEAQTNPNFTYDDAIKAIGKKLAESNPISIRTPQGRQLFYDQYYYNNIFSGWQTQLRNIWGGFANGIVYKNALLAGDYVASKLLTSGLLPKFLRPANIDDLVSGVSLKNIADYNRAYFGALKQGLENFQRVYSDPFYVPATESPDINYYVREYQKKQLPAVLRQIANFMEGTDQILGTMAEAGELAVAKKRGLNDKQAAEQAFLLRQEILGRSEFKPFKAGETGWVDAIFEKIGSYGTQLKGGDSAWNYITTPLFPVLRLAVNFQKLKARLFPPTQLINILTKNPANRTLTDYAYLSVGTATSAFAIQKYLNGELAFEAPKDEAEKKLFYDSGRKPYSVKIGDNWIPFAYLELFSAPLIYMAAMRAAFQEDPETLTEGDITKFVDANSKFIKAFFISPTYLQVVSKLLSSGNGYEKDPISSTAAFASTGFIPFIGFLKDVVDVIDPIKRKKQESWDEFKALIPDITTNQFSFEPNLRSSLEPYTSSDLQPVPLTTSELYAPYGIGKSDPRFNKMFEDTISTKQERKVLQQELKPEKERVTKTQDELELAILQNDFDSQIKLASELTTSQIDTVKNRIKNRVQNEALSPRERALNSLSTDQLNTLLNVNPTRQAEINKALDYKNNFELPQQSIFDNLKRLGTDFKPEVSKPRKPKIRKLRIKKVRAKIKKGRIKQPKLKKLKPIKLKTLKPVV